MDDFGANEHEYDTYAEKEKVTARCRETVEVLGKVFAVDATAFPFIVSDRGPDGVVDEVAFGRLVTEASEHVARYLVGKE